MFALQITANVLVVVLLVLISCESFVPSAFQDFKVYFLPPEGFTTQLDPFIPPHISRFLNPSLPCNTEQQ